MSSESGVKLKNSEIRCRYEYDGGNLMARSCVQDGKLEGERIFWYISGEIWHREYYRDGKLNGESTSWSGNGKVGHRVYYRDVKMVDECFTLKKRRIFCSLKRCFRENIPKVFNTVLISDLERIF